MTKKLEEMSFSELGRLFPIIISEHNPEWKDLYISEKAILEQAIGIENIVRINHYGSTSIPGLPAKPTIDILIEIRGETDNDKLISDIESIGYIYSLQPYNPAPHIMFMKGYTPDGFKGQAYHLHVRYSGDWDELYFRDYLLLHPDISKEYGILKRQLKEEYEHDREGYTQGKTGFIKRVTQQARKELLGRYRG